VISALHGLPFQDDVDDDYDDDDDGGGCGRDTAMYVRPAIDHALFEQGLS
jgi:hypothetical protein